jgi:CDP-diacylglycerol--glycerol-3-phosphate 3-phosphatidyltransferase
VTAETRAWVRHLPNTLTVLRLVALPFFVVVLWQAPQGRSTAAFVLFAAASVTDWFDGYIARRFDVSTRFGRLADPLADRLLIGSAVLLLWWHGRVPVLVVVLVLGRDLLLLSGLGFVAAERGYQLSVIYVGKAATFVLMSALGLMMLTTSVIADVLLWVGVTLSLTAAAVYIVTASRTMKEPSSSR